MAAGERSYNAVVVEHFRSPRNSPCHAAAADVVHGSAGRIDDGVLFRLSARIEGEKLADIRFEAYGCPYAIAAASRVTEQLQGRTIAQARLWSWRPLMKELEVPGERRGRLLVLEDALRDLLKACPGSTS